MEHRSAPRTIVAAYREYAPRPELRPYVRALFWFGPSHDDALGARRPIRAFNFASGDSFFSPVFADGHASLVFDLGQRYDHFHGWQASRASAASVMGPITSAGAAPSAEPPAMIGVYLRPRSCSELLAVPALELTDRVIALGDVWSGWSIEPALADRRGSELESLRVVEKALIQRLNVSSSYDRSARAAELASLIERREGRITVSQLCDLAGVSRQHLSRVFHERVGVGPKLYARLARFRAGLRRVAERSHRLSWAQLAIQLGYADQSHLIAEFREFSSLTPEQIVAGRRFHPFLGDSTDRT